MDELTLIDIYCKVDDFCKTLKNDQNFQISREKPKRGINSFMTLSELMTILISYHSSNFKNFKSYYFFLKNSDKNYFRKLLSYTRFIDLIPYTLIPLTRFMESNYGETTGTSFIDSTPLKICHNRRINRNKTFDGIAERGHSSMGWFYGFKLHIIVNEVGDILKFCITRGNINDRAPVAKMCEKLTGKLYGDKGYLSKKLFEELYEKGLKLVTNIKKNMKNKIVEIEEKLMLRKRFIIETINDQLKNISDIEHSRHRSPANFLVNVVAGLISYNLKDKKPSIKSYSNKKKELSTCN